MARRGATPFTVRRPYVTPKPSQTARVVCKQCGAVFAGVKAADELMAHVADITARGGEHR